MFSVEYTNVAKQHHSILQFNSIAAALKFMKEILNDKDVQQYIEHLRRRKKLDALNFAQNEKQLYPLYGDIDKPMAALSDLTSEVVFDRGLYEYRLGSSSPMFYEGFGHISFRVKNVSQSVQSSETNKLNNRNTVVRETFPNEYGRPYHE